MRLAVELKRLPREIEEEMTAADLAEWVAYFNLQAEAEKKAYEDAKSKAKGRK